MKKQKKKKKKNEWQTLLSLLNSSHALSVIIIFNHNTKDN